MGQGQYGVCLEQHGKAFRAAVTWATLIEGQYQFLSEKGLDETQKWLTLLLLGAYFFHLYVAVLRLLNKLIHVSIIL